MYSGGGLTSCSNSSNSDNGKLENNENTESGGNTDDGGKVEREITAQYEAEGGAVLLTFYDDGTFEFKNDKGYVSKGTYTKSGGKITGTLTSGGYTGFEFEFDTSTGNVKMNDMLITGFEEVTTPSDPNDKDNPSNPKPNEPEIVVPEYLELKGTVIIKFIESKLPDDGAVEIPEGVTGTTNSEVFYFNKKIKSVTIPSTMTKISDRAFKWCENLESVKICDGVKEIGESAFEDCDSLKSVNIPSSVTTIGERAFYLCFNLTEINIPDGVTEIGERAFYNCRFTGDVVIPASVTKIGKSAFANNFGLQSVTFEDAVGWYDNNEEEIDVSDSTKNMSELTSQNPGKWGNLGIYKKTN